MARRERIQFQEIMCPIIKGCSLYLIVENYQAQDQAQAQAQAQAQQEVLNAAFQ